MVVSHFFGDQLAKRFLAQAIPVHRSQDVRAWRASCSLKAATKDHYNLYKREPVKQLDGVWIQKLGVYSKVSLFVCEVACGCLPTRLVLRDNGMDFPPTYPCYEREDKILDHILFLYLRPKQIWRISSFHPMVAQSKSLVQFFLEALQCNVSSEASRLFQNYLHRLPYLVDQ